MPLKKIKKNIRLLPLSNPQKAIWIAQQLDKLNARYNCGGFLSIRGKLNTQLYKKAIYKTLIESESLRVQFIDDGDDVFQTVKGLSNESVEVIDLSQEIEPEKISESLMKSDLLKPVELTKDTLFKLILFKISDQHHFAYIRHHHIVMDGFGQVIFWQRAAEIYTALIDLSQLETTQFVPLGLLLEQEAEYQNSSKCARDKKYWLNKLNDQPSPTKLTKLQSPIASRGLLRRKLQLTNSQTTQLQNTANALGVRWSVVVVAAVAAYLHRMTGESDIIIGLPVAARLTVQSLSTPCMLANELPLRLQVDANLTITNLVQQVSNQLAYLLKHQRYPSDVLHRDLNRSISEQKLVGLLVNVISFDNPLKFADLEVTSHHLSTGPVTDLLIGFYGKSNAEDVQIYFDANPDIYNVDEIEKHQQRFLHFFDEIIFSDQKNIIGDVDLLLSTEKQQLKAFNDTNRQYDLSKCLHELIDEQALRTPDAIAVSIDDHSLTYKSLIEKSNQLAIYLRKQGVKTRQFIGVYEQRSLELVINLLAILKVGGAYVPLDPNLPISRINFQVEDAGIKVVLSCSTLTLSLDDSNVFVIHTDRQLQQLQSVEVFHRTNMSTEDPAYVIYTSGSTGRPKGVIVPHRGIVNRLMWMQEAYQLNQQDCVLQKTPFTFDVSVWEFFWPLLTGARLFLAAPEKHRDPRYLVKIICEQSITTLHFVPPMLDLFLMEHEASNITSLRRVICSGEALRTETVSDFFNVFNQQENVVELYNLYGPTEASIDVTAWQCHAEDSSDSIPIGHAIANTRLYILDANGKILPPGVQGELYIAGVQVASGYINRTELTAERFVTLPAIDDGPMYRTGDLAHYREDGALEFSGRIDHQVKIRGFRIELGEIESVLLKHPFVKQTVVTDWEYSPTDRRLIAYFVSQNSDKSARSEVKELQSFLGKQLPDYMVPSHFVEMDELPFLTNGKINRKALPQLKIQVESSELVFPSTENEKRLCKACCAVLNLEQIGITQSLFSLGIDSMLIIRLRAAMEKEGYTFNVQELFQFPTIKDLASRLHKFTKIETSINSQEPFSLLAKEDLSRLSADVVDAYPLSAMQNGMLFQTELEPDSAVYRVVTSLQIAAAYNQECLSRAIDDTFRRHPALRSSFDLSNYSEPIQLVHDVVDVIIKEQEDLASLSQDEQRQFIHNWAQQAKFHQFDPLVAPLLFFAVHRLSEQEFQLSVVEHHVVLDGWSDVLMLEEIVKRYSAYLSDDELWMPEIASSYQAFIAEEQHVLKNIQAREFWLAKLINVEPIPLPRRAYLSATKPVTEHKTFHATLPARLIRSLRNIAKEQALPLKSLLAAVHLSVLRLVCNSNTVLTGLVFNGRLEQEGGDQVIGVFLNTLPIQIDTSEHDLLSVARAVFEYEADALPYGRYPYVKMQQDVGKQLQLDSYVNFMDFHRDWHNLDKGSRLIKDTIGIADTNFPLAVNFLIDPLNNNIRLWLDCDISVLEPEFCRNLTKYYERALFELVNSPQTKITQLDLITAQEHQLLTDWNNTTTEYDRELTVHKLISQQAHLNAQSTALAYRWDELSYRELDIRANQLAHYLMKFDLKANQLIGISLARGVELVISMLAVLKVGAAYVPLDPVFPKQRIEYIVQDAEINILITDINGPQCLNVEQSILVDVEAETIAAQPTNFVDVCVNGKDLAYVIYTSGSTGLPKGTKIKHQNVINFFVGMDKKITCNDDEVVLAVTSVSFDISVLEILWPLTKGAKVVLSSEGFINNLTRDETLSVKALEFALHFRHITVDNHKSEKDIQLIQDTQLIQDKLTASGWNINGFLSFSVNQLIDSENNSDACFTLPCTESFFQQAGESGVKLQSHMFEQDVKTLTQNIKIYRDAWCTAGHEGQGHVTVILPTFMFDNTESDKQQAQTLFKNYLIASPDLLHRLFADLEMCYSGSMSENDRESALNIIVDRYFEQVCLSGTPSVAVENLHSLVAAGVDEITCVIDSRQSIEDCLHNLSMLNELHTLYKNEIADVEHTFVDLCQRHNVSLLQGTPSFMSAVVLQTEALQSLQSIRAILIGGEAFPIGLAEQLVLALPDVRIFNMYGPTETTIWSSVHEIERNKEIQSNAIPIGQPIANTNLQVLDSQQRILPIGVEGELWIGGEGVAIGYLNNEELTAERFQLIPGFEEPFYRTGDRVSWRSDGQLMFLGRFDRQIKIRGHRIEPDEIESCLSRHPKVAEVAVVTQTNANGVSELVAYAAPVKQSLTNDTAVEHVQHWQEIWQTAYSDKDLNSVVECVEPDFSGWLSSYTSEPIPEVQMKEWLQQTINKIILLQPEKVIDVGVGVGLLLRELAPLVQHYIGIDISEAALQKASRLIQYEKFDRSKIELICGDANRLDELRTNSGSVIIINSVIQYFPSQDYLKHVLIEASRIAGTKGAVFIGDVRSMDLLKAFHASVQLHRAPPLSTVKELLNTIDKKISTERELCISNTFFDDLISELPCNMQCRIELKRGHSVNELTTFRYDVSLFGEEHILAKQKPEKIFLWQNIEDFNGFLKLQDPNSTFVIKNIPNQRLIRTLKLIKLLDVVEGDTSIWELERELWRADDESILSPEAIAEMAEKKGWKIELSISSSRHFDIYDAIFEPGPYQPHQQPIVDNIEHKTSSFELECEK